MHKIGADYEKAEEAAHNIWLDYGIKSAPVDLVWLLFAMNIDLVPYSTLSQKKRKAALAYSNDGYKKYDFNLQKWVIYYNDTGRTAERSRFTIAHELGHIVLGHAMENKIAETEANHFAKCLLAPLPLIWLLCYRDNCVYTFEIAETFGISSQCADFVANNYVNSMRYHSAKIINCKLAKYFQEQLKLAS